MSDEPQTSGKIVVMTSSGDLQIELWCKETPRTCRNFLQLAMEGFYDDTLFHRLVPKYILQGGLNEARQPLATFSGEINNRLKFTRRGLLAMVNTTSDGECRKVTHLSQFFFTLGATPDLDRTCSIFGRVVGDTVFNLVRMGETFPVEEISNVRILGVKVIINPFDDIVVREIATNIDCERKEPKKRKPKTTLTFDISNLEEKKTIAKDLVPSVAITRKLDELEEQIKKLKKEIKNPYTSKKGKNSVDSGPMEKKKSLLELEREKYLNRNPRNGHNSEEMETLIELNKFKKKLVEPSDKTEEPLVGQVEEDVLVICKLHGLANCESCRGAFGLSHYDHDTLEASNSWMFHHLIFAESEYSRQIKDQQRQDLQDLVVINPKKRVSKN